MSLHNVEILSVNEIKAIHNFKGLSTICTTQNTNVQRFTVYTHTPFKDMYGRKLFPFFIILTAEILWFLKKKKENSFLKIV